MSDLEGNILAYSSSNPDDDRLSWESDLTCRILIGTDTFVPDVNGAARFTRDHAVRLAKQGYEVHVIAPATCFKTTSGIETYDGEDIHVHRLRSVRWPFHDWLRFSPPWEVRRKVRRVVEKVKPDLAHIQSFMVIGRALAVEADELGIPVVATNHVMPENLIEYSGIPKAIHPRLVKFGWHLASSTYTRVKVITSPTPIAAQYLETQVGLGRVEPVSCGIDLSRFVRKEEKPKDLRVLYVGRLDREKNINTLIQAFARLPRELNAQLDIVGSGSERGILESLAAQCHISDRVNFHGRVSDEELVKIHHQATVFVMPSPAELQSLASLEAMASGTPIVVADAMALPHLLTEGHEGHLVPTYDVDAYADRIERLLSLSPEEYVAYSNAAFLKARQHDSSQVILQYEDIYARARQAHFFTQKMGRSA